MMKKREPTSTVDGCELRFARLGLPLFVGICREIRLPGSLLQGSWGMEDTRHYTPRWKQKDNADMQVDASNPALTRSSSREVRMRVPDFFNFFSVVYFRGTLPPKKKQ